MNVSDIMISDMNSTQYAINKKTMQRYLILSDAIDCTNDRCGNDVVVYCSDSEDDPLIYVRDKSEFIVKFDFVKEK
jgi:hypothetical protein